MIILNGEPDVRTGKEEKELSCCENVESATIHRLLDYFRERLTINVIRQLPHQNHRP